MADKELTKTIAVMVLSQSQDYAVQGMWAPRSGHYLVLSGKLRLVPVVEEIVSLRTVVVFRTDCCEWELSARWNSSFSLKEGHPSNEGCAVVNFANSYTGSTNQVQLRFKSEICPIPTPAFLVLVGEGEEKQSEFSESFSREQRSNTTA